ncbi:lytic transglycosylase domain-containing protein [uncultured Halomonas sp.]|uniref:lytic transglycosylase domain-containing protein n=1 Tax=uncultured Halomonas sp. TaxID=173971 RepID=UPI00260DC1EC|nr:lytic transglycosylase domain-containing protein [uncultured Halomonas sp.]
MAGNTDLGSLLIGLGLDVDARSFDKGIASFNGLRRAALATSGAITAAVGGAAVVHRAAETRNALYLQAEALGFSADEADRLGHAMEQLGGDSGNAIGVLQQMRDLRADAAFGEGPLFDIGKFGIDPSGIINAQDEVAALLNLSGQLQGVNDTNQALALGTLGFEGTGIANLLRGGPAGFQAEMDRAAELRAITDEQLEVSNELIRATNEFSRALDAATDNLVERFAPALTGVVDWATDAVRGESGILEDPPKNGAAPGVGEFIRQMKEQDGGQRDTSQAPSPRGGYEVSDALLDALAMQESGGRHRDAQGRLTRSSAGALGAYQILPGTGADPGFGIDPLRSNSLEDQRDFAEDFIEAMLQRYDGNLSAALSAYHSGTGRVDELLERYGDDFDLHLGPIGRGYAPSVMNHLGGRDPFERPQASVSVTVGSIRVDGAQDPQATAKAVRYEIQRLADTAATDHRNPIV